MNSVFDFVDKRVLVIGADQDIARLVTAMFLEAGAHVVAQHSDPDASITSPADSSNFASISMPVINAEGAQQAVNTAIEILGGLDILINATEVRSFQSIAEITPESWAKVVDHSVAATQFCSQYAAPSLIASHGAIVNVTSNLALMAGASTTTEFSAAAGAIVQLTRMTALRLGVDGVRVNCVCYGDELASNRDADVTSLGRACEPGDVAPTVLFLSSHLSRGTTGAINVVDCGVHSGH